ncbi:hypothetical protein N9146_02975, partial [Akkermansiaceae bacterium]|nr:hypothetical protein [Akkermansiaceae bacterium]
MIPGTGIIERSISLVMINLAEPCRVVSMLAEVCRQSQHSSCSSTPVSAITVNPCIVGTPAAENGGTGGVTGGRRTIRPAEENP